MDQFACKEHCNTTMALIRCELKWLGWLDGDVDFVCHLTLVKLFLKLSAKTWIQLISIHMWSIGLSVSLIIINRGSSGIEILKNKSILLEECHKVQSSDVFYSLRWLTIQSDLIQITGFRNMLMISLLCLTISDLSPAHQMFNWIIIV